MLANSLHPHLDVRDCLEAVDITLQGCKQLDEECLQAVREELLDLLAGLEHRHVFVNLVHVGYMQSAGLGLLLTLKQRLDRTGGRLTLCNLNPLVRELFLVTRLLDYFHVLDAHHERVCL